MKKRSYSDYINDILESIEDIESFIRDVDYNGFINNKMCRNAVIRSLEIIGESAKSIPQDLREKYANIPFILRDW